MTTSKHYFQTIALWIYPFVDKYILTRLLRVFYPHKYYPELNTDSLSLLSICFFQKIIGINRSVPWPVHFTSKVVPWKNIKMGRMVNPGLMGGQYIQANNGIVFGTNVLVAPNVCIISGNHDINDYSKHTIANPITIGDNVWIGANSVILPGVNVGNNVIIAAGSIVTNDIPDNSVAAGNPCRIVSKKPPYQGGSDLCV